MGQPAREQYEPDYYTDMPVGEILRRARIHYGQSLADIERALRIRASQIQAIEESDLDKLPGRVYAIGFVRSYAEYLGLDGGRMVQLFKLQSVGAGAKPALNFPAAASESKLPPWWLVALSVLAAIAGIAAWSALHRTDRAYVEDIPQVPRELQDRVVADAFPTVAPAETVPENPAPVMGPPEPQAEAAPPPPPGIILNIRQNSWVEIRDSSGRAIVSRVLKAGDQYFVPGRADLSMSLGNAGGVEILLDGKPLPLLGKRGEVIRNIPLDMQALNNIFKAQDPDYAGGGVPAE